MNVDFRGVLESFRAAQEAIAKIGKVLPEAAKEVLSISNNDEEELNGDLWLEYMASQIRVYLRADVSKAPHKDDARRALRAVKNALEAWKVKPTDDADLAHLVGLSIRAGMEVAFLIARDSWALEVGLAWLAGGKKPRPGRQNKAVRWCRQNRSDWLTASRRNLYNAWKSSGETGVTWPQFLEALKAARRRHRKK